MVHMYTVAFFKQLRCFWRQFDCLLFLCVFVSFIVFIFVNKRPCSAYYVTPYNFAGLNLPAVLEIVFHPWFEAFFHITIKPNTPQRG